MLEYLVYPWFQFLTNFLLMWTWEAAVILGSCHLSSHLPASVLPIVNTWGKNNGLELFLLSPTLKKKKKSILENVYYEKTE